VAWAEGQRNPSRATRVWTPATSFTGRADDVVKLIGLLESYSLVTVTGPGGVGKTRLAAEVARRVEDRFPDGVWFAELGAVADATQVLTEVTSAFGVRQDPGRPPLEVLAEVLAPRRLLLIIDNCEHVLPAVASLCRALLGRADEVRVLATSREQIGMDGEARYRLSPLELPHSGEPGAVRQSSAAALFIERAGQADSRFSYVPEHAPLIARVVSRLDGMPLAIELAAARVAALGMSGLAARVDDALPLLAGKDPLLAGKDPRAVSRHRSLVSVADWSYRLLGEPEQRVFRRLAVFPGPFTLEAAEAVAGADADLVVLRLVDCSLLVPPRPGADQRIRYTMLRTLRGYAVTRLREAGEERQAEAALAGYAQSVAERAAAGLEACDGDAELGALRWLDAEDAVLDRALGWALDHDPGGALRLVTALAPWLDRRGRIVEARTKLTVAVARSAAAGITWDDDTWATAQLWLGHLASHGNDQAGSVDHFTTAIDAYRDREPSPMLIRVLASGRVIVRLNQGDLPNAVQDARRALAMARELGDATSVLLALAGLGISVYYAGEAAEALDCIGQAQELLSSAIPGWANRWCHYILALVLAQSGKLESARRACVAGLNLTRKADDPTMLVSLLGVMGDLERTTGNLVDAGAHLREAIVTASRIGSSQMVTNLVEQCGYVCAEIGRWADAAALWAAMAADREQRGRPDGPVNEGLHATYLRRAEQALTPGQLLEARDRGAKMPVSAAAELAAMATTAAEPASPESPAPGKLLTPRERELVTLVAQGCTNADIAARLYISVRTVGSHLDRIRDKTGYRRRADLTRLALGEGLC
jgi:predicted ATPase/DNA-binding CsgD family transcriptional regulator